ncbi:MAG: cytochrome c oxidase subunit 4 [Nocardioidaceae bacterium]|nr:MAG: cytochrome c oxidase subunit 4 [Nocardioidaceae bacterium]
MKAETWTLAVCTTFFVLVAPAYWLIAEEPTGTAALVMTALLLGLVTFYLGFHSRRMEPRPEDNKDGEIADGAGEYGFFPPYSWWPLWCALCLSLITYAAALQLWWLLVIGIGIGAVALAGWVFEYYRGEHAH